MTKARELTTRDLILNLTSAVGVLVTRVDTLTDRVDTLTERVDTLTDDVSEIKGVLARNNLH